jgi:hypothetical protein
MIYCKRFRNDSGNLQQISPTVKNFSAPSAYYFCPLLPQPRCIFPRMTDALTDRRRREMKVAMSSNPIRSRLTLRRKGPYNRKRFQ